MSVGAGAEILWFVMAFTLVLSALVVRRLPMRAWLKMALAWAAIFALLFLAIRAYQLIAG